jgi:triphosphoribosyl-dephospho-CoA synthetase
MRCFYVSVHGSLEWENDPASEEDVFRPAGFYCHRYVLAAGYQEAAEKAFRSVRRNLEKQTGWLNQGLAKLTLEAAELAPAPMYKLLRRKPGNAFYAGDSGALAGAE